jgi:DtxR family transcriptional regulator, Mn-dependent transcriptional regulator
LNRCEENGVATSTVENYLKQLYLQQHTEDGKMVPMGRLAEAMGVVPGTATSMVKALADSGLVQYAPRGGVRLTASGEQLALHVLRRHRLVELFLVKVLGLDWAEVHEEADELEHVISDRVLQRIDTVLGHPTADPHGDPIPSDKGQIHDPRRMSLADCPVGVPVRIARVVDQEVEFLRFMEKQGLMPGAMVTALERQEAGAAVAIRVGGRKRVSLGLAAAEKILVEPRRRKA